MALRFSADYALLRTPVFVHLFQNSRYNLGFSVTWLSVIMPYPFLAYLVSGVFLGVILSYVPQLLIFPCGLLKETLDLNLPPHSFKYRNSLSL